MNYAKHAQRSQPKAAPQQDSKPPLPSDDAEAGQRFRLELQRHAQRPKLWRLRIFHVAADGSESATATEWREFPDFSPDLMLAQGRLKRFIFGDVAPNAQAQRRT